MTRVSGPLRVAIVEDHTLFAESLDVALTLEGHVVHRLLLDHPATTTTSVLTSVLRSNSQVALLDLELGRVGSGMRLIDPLRRAGIAVVVVTSSSDHVQWGECLRLGARTVLEKSVPLNKVLSTIRHIGEGRAPMSRETRDYLIAGFHRDRSDLHEIRDRLATLTCREREVLGHLMAGRAVREIATLGVVSEATVRTQVKSILAKMQVSSQLAAVGQAHRLHGCGPAVEVVVWPGSREPLLTE